LTRQPGASPKPAIFDCPRGIFDCPAPLVTRFGAWGAGVNGGGWLRIDAHHVDLLYRDLRRVRAVIEQCVRSEIDAGLFGADRRR